MPSSKRRRGVTSLVLAASVPAACGLSLPFMRAPLSIIEAHAKTLIWNEEHVRSFDVEEHPPPSGGGSRSFFYTPLKIVQPRSAIPSDPGAQSIARHMGSFKDVVRSVTAYRRGRPGCTCRRGSAMLFFANNDVDTVCLP